jgi:hypothetical protein
MKKILYILLPVLFLFSCKSKLDDVKLNDNPYDREYEGAKVVRVDSIRNVKITSTVYANKINLTALTGMYIDFSLYRNGVFVKTANRTSYDAVLTEVIYDYGTVSGTTNSYTVALKFDDNKTQQSDPFTFRTP